jgi:hypothetical protein
MHTDNIDGATAVLNAATRQTLRLPDAMIVVGHVVAVPLWVAVHRHHVVRPTLELWYVLVAALLRQVAQLLLTIARVWVHQLAGVLLALRLRLFHGAVGVMFGDAVFYDAFRSDDGADADEGGCRFGVVHHNGARSTAHG